MALGLDARKPIQDLTLDDLRSFPIWEFASDEKTIDGRDETCVRPVDAMSIDRDRPASLSVAADFETASGRQLAGLVGLAVAIWDDGSVESSNAVVITDRKYVFAWPARGSERGEVASEFGLSEEEFFPLAYQVRVLVLGESTRRAGVLNESPQSPIRIPPLRGDFTQ